jgi:hypothetical protein
MDKACGKTKEKKYHKKEGKKKHIDILNDPQGLNPHFIRISIEVPRTYGKLQTIK